MSIGASLHYLVFSTSGFRGNPVTLCAVDQLDDDEALFRESLRSATEDNVYYHVSGKDRCEVRFMSGKREIQFCGHGLLALANHLGKGSTTFDMEAVASGNRSWQLVARENAIWIRMPVVPSVACCLEDSPVVELLKTLEVDFNSLYAFGNSAWVATTPNLDALLSLRAEALQQCHHHYDAPGALILTTLLPEGSYALRYFAPWHGKTEDSATGSAQGCLAPLWLSTGQQCQVFQHSPQGIAEMLVRLELDGVWLTGAVCGPVPH